MKATLEYFRWYLFVALWCKHERDEESGTLVNCGMNKIWFCRKCGKCIDLI